MHRLPFDSGPPPLVATPLEILREKGFLQIAAPMVRYSKYVSVPPLIALCTGFRSASCAADGVVILLIPQ